MQKSRSSKLHNSDNIAQKMHKMRVLTSLINNEPKLDLTSTLFGFTISQLDLQKQERLIRDLKKQFSSIKESLVAYKQIKEDDAVTIAFDFVQHIKKIKQTGSNSQQQLSQLVSILNINLAQTIENKYFIMQKWQKQARELQENLLNQQYILKFLQEEKNMAQKQKLESEKQGWQCQVCLIQIDPATMGILECGHIFHPECLNGYLKSQIQSNNLDIRCPMEGCKKSIQTNDIYNYIDGELVQKFQKFSFNKFVESNASNFSWCPTAGCSAVFEFDNVLDNYRCLACKKHYCLKCRCPYHTGMTCAEYRVNNTFDKNDEKFVDFAKGAKFKQCPKCKYWVERNEGCPTMTCKCGQHFCYTCGGIGCPHGSCSNSGGVKAGGAKPGGGFFGLFS